MLGTAEKSNQSDELVALTKPILQSWDLIENGKYNKFKSNIKLIF